MVIFPYVKEDLAKIAGCRWRVGVGNITAAINVVKPFEEIWKQNQINQPQMD